MLDQVKGWEMLHTAGSAGFSTGLRVRSAHMGLGLGISEHFTHCIPQKHCPPTGIVHRGVEGTCSLLGLLSRINKVPHCLLSVGGFCVCHVAAGIRRLPMGANDREMYIRNRKASGRVSVY